ncbi:MAG: large conductance mechanosensitive channel protein MscL [Saprospiraceae bacterium]|nr:large conductance mechanosensitive channel protein MscL [Saprospiraceae bacterium]
MWKEFKKFIMTGNVIDFAVGVILAGAVGAVVNGFVADIAMPIVGYLSGGIDFSDMKMVLAAAEIGADGKEIKPEVAIFYGRWITSIISLVTVGAVLFMVVKAMNAARKPVAAPPAGPSDIDLLTEIRDLLKK